MNDYILLEPMICGEVELNIKKKESEQIIIIDTISRDDIIQCAEGCFLITKELLDSLKNSNLKGVNVLKPQHIKFSARHNIDYPNQKMPDWYRIIPFKYDRTNQQEIFLNEAGKLIVNQRVDEVLKSHRLIRASRYDYNLSDMEDFEDDLEEQAVFKEEKEGVFGQVIIFIVLMITIIYLFFK